MSMDTLTQYAALAEWIYARNNTDQPMQLSEIATGSVVPIDEFFGSSNPNTGLTLADDKYYSERGFVGTVIRQGVGSSAKYIVVLRGSDWGSADPLALLPGMIAGTSPSGNELGTFALDGGDWEQNRKLSWGTYDELTQASDAIALTKAALLAAGVDLNDPLDPKRNNVVVVGQSLGAGLAGLVSAVLGIESHGISPAPLYDQIQALAEIEAVKAVNSEFSINIAINDPSVNAPLSEDTSLFNGIYSEYASIASAVRSFFQSTVSTIAGTYVANLVAKFHGYRNQGEALSSGPIALGLQLGSNHFPVSFDLYDYGDSNHIALHHPTAHLLSIQTESMKAADGSSRAMTALTSGDETLRQAFFEIKGISGPLNHARADTMTDTTSKMGSSGSDPMVMFRALSKSVVSDGGLYEYFYQLFGNVLQSGSAAEGLNTPLVGLHEGIVKIALGILRDATQDTTDLSELQTNLGGTWEFAGSADGLLPYSDRVVLDIARVTSNDPQHLEVIGGGPGRKFGVIEINWGIFARAAEALGGLIFGQQAAEELFGTTASNVLQGISVLPWEVLVAQAGSADGAIEFAPDSKNGARSHAIFGGAGADNVLGSAVNDYILGLNGNDKLDGSDGNDIIVAGEGDDTLNGGLGKNVLLGGAGKDTADYSMSELSVSVILNADELGSGGDSQTKQQDSLFDVENVIASKYADTIEDTSLSAQHNSFDGREGDDTLKGGTGDDTLAGGSGSDTLDGGADKDTVDYSKSTVGVNVIILAGQSNSVSGAGGDVDTLISIENVIASDFADTVIGDKNATEDNLFDGRAGNDTLGGGKGNDTLVGGYGSDSLDGGDGIDWADYSQSIGGITAKLEDYKVDPSYGGTAVFGLVDHQDLMGSSSDNIYGIERLVGSVGENDVVWLSNSQLQWHLYGEVGNGVELATGESDARIVVEGFEELRTTSDDDVIGTDLGFERAHLAVETIEFDGLSTGLFKHINADAGNDLIFAANPVEFGDGQTFAEEIKELYIDAGVGNDTVFGEGAAEIFLGAGDDVLLHAGRGSVIHGGEGADTFHYSDGILIADAAGVDSISYQGVTLGLALAWGGAESQWATFVNSSLVRAAFNVDGDLVLQDLASFARAGWDVTANSALYNMYFANGNRDPNAAPEDRTAGVQVAAVEIDAVRLMDLQAGQLKGMFTLLDLLVDDYNKAVKDNNLSPGGDPLVLDLDGDGLELMARSSVAPLFDVDGDMFSERTGWAMRDDGFLAVDANSNGKIDDVSEMFGSQTASGFVELATYDSNSDGKVDASDTKFGDLRIWQDKDGDAVTDAGELLTLSQAKIVSISTGSSSLNTKNALNNVAAEGSFTRDDSTTGGIYDVRFLTNDFKSVYIGDNSVTAAVAANQPNLKGRGTLMDLHVALSHDPTIGSAYSANGRLAEAIAANLPQMDTLELRDLEDNTGTLTYYAEKILVAWGQAAELVALSPDEEVKLYYWSEFGQSETEIGRAYRVDGIGWRVQMYNGADPDTYADHATRSEALTAGILADSRWGTSRIRSDGVSLIVETDANGAESVVNFGHGIAVGLTTIGMPGVPSAEEHDFTFTGIRFASEQAMVTGEYSTWESLAISAYLNEHDLGRINSLPADRELRSLVPSHGYLLEHYLGIDIPFENSGLYVPAMMPTVLEALNRIETAIDLMAVRLAMQGPLEPFFVGVRYDVAADAFKPTTNRQLVPMFEAIFTEGLANHSSGMASWFGSWEDVMRVFLGGYQRGGSQQNTYPFLYATIIAAYENFVLPAFPSSTLPISIYDSGIAFGVPADQIRTGSGLINGTSDIDLFYLGAGNDTAKGGEGEDSYIVGKDFGQDVIDDHEEPLEHSFDTLRFAQLNPGDITAVRDGLDLIFTVNGKSDTLRIVNQFYEIIPFLTGGNTQPEGGVSEIVFADGTVWAAQDIALAVSHPLATDENLVGTDHIDVLDGGAGKDTLSGGDNADIYIFGKGYGQDLVQEKMELITNVETDLLIFRDGLTENDITFYREGNSFDLQIKVNGADDVLTIQNQFDSTYTGPFGQRWFNRIEQFNFADKATLSHEDIARKIIKQRQTDGNDTIYGYDYEDRFDGGKGDDSLLGGNENDVYVFGKGYGHDTIRDAISVDHNLLSGQVDRVEFGAGIGTADIILSRDGGSNNLTMSLADGSSLTVMNQFYRNNLGMVLDWIEEFKFSDGTIWTADQVQEMLIQQGKTAGDDKIYGFFRADTIDGGAGNDTMIGGDHADTYIFGIGGGLDEVLDQQTSIFADGDRIQLGEGITPENIRLWRTGNDLHIVIVDQEDRLTIKGQFTTYGENLRFTEVEELRFANGTVWTRTEIETYLLASTDGNDLIIGFSSADVIDGGLGNDTLKGAKGGDTYIFNAGGGQDVIDEDNSGGSGDKMVFGEGLLSSDAVFSRADESLTIGFKGSTDTVTIVDQFNTAGGNIRGHEIEQLHFADGKVWTRSDIELTFLQSTAGDDSLHGFGDSNTLDGGLGNDTLNGDTNHDTYLFSLGGGQDLIDDEGDTGGNSDRLVFGAGIAAGDLRLSRSGNNAILGIVGTDDRVTIENQCATATLGTQIAEIQFADSTVWDYATFAGFYKQGTSGANSLSGSATSDYLDGLGGADTLTGGQGYDTYVVDNAGDKVVEAADEGLDTVESNVTHTLAANVEDLILTGTSAISGTGNDLANLIIGNAGNNTLDGGAGGADTLRGGLGNDTYIMAALDDVIVELSGEGTDTVSSSIDYTLIDNVENLVLTGGATVGIGNSGGNVITGTSAADNLSGLDGDDTLDSGAGTDTLAGGKGNDTYVYDGTDTIAEAADEGTDTVQFGSTLDLNTLSNVENLTLTGSTAVNGTGTSANNSIIGNTGANKLIGNDGSDTLNGGTGADTLVGGAGDDVYIVDNTKDIVTEASGAGFDSIQSSVDYTLSADVETLTLTGTSSSNGTGNALDNVITGNGSVNALNGGAGADTLIGGKAGDTYTVDTTADVIIEVAGEGTDTVNSSVTLSLAAIANVENLTLTGSAADGTGNSLSNAITGNNSANHLTGAEGDDTLNGSDGADTMTGVVGDDTYVIDNAGDIIVEFEGEGIDTVESSMTHTLAVPFENLTLTGVSALNGTGNDAANRITGNFSTNKLSGGLGNDTLDGNNGADTMTGGVGDDVYMVDNAGDVIIEISGEGNDSVHSTFSYTLASTLENLTLAAGGSINGTGNDSDNKIQGFSGANSLTGGLGNDTIDGGGGVDSLVGGAGDDTYIVDSSTDVITEVTGEGTDTVQSTVAYTLGAELEKLQLLGTSNINGTGNTLNNSLTGNTGKNSLSGGDGDDTLDGRAGIDTLAGGVGNDLYLHGRGAGGDVINNGDAAGTDALRFGSDIDVYQLWFEQSGNDLKISVIGTGDVATVQGWYAGASNQIDEIRTADGNMVLDYSEVQQLVDAMAAFSPPPQGQLTLSQEVHDALTPTVAATWQSAA